MPQTYVTFIAGERKDTRTGKERYVVRSDDGREFSIWDRNVYQTLMQHLHEEVMADMYSKQDQRGTWWNTVQGLPELGVAAQDNRSAGGGGGGGTNPTPVGLALDLTDITRILERIALAMENFLAFQVERYMTQPVPEVPNDEPEPPDA